MPCFASRIGAGPGSASTSSSAFLVPSKQTTPAATSARTTTTPPTSSQRRRLGVVGTARSPRRDRITCSARRAASRAPWRNYRRLNLKWFAREIGQRRVRDIDEAAIERIFGRMRSAGLSPLPHEPRQEPQRAVLPMGETPPPDRAQPFGEFELPTSTYVSREHTPGEVDQLCRLSALKRGGVSADR
jgi:hypothetical protein